MKQQFKDWRAVKNAIESGKLCMKPTALERYFTERNIYLPSIMHLLAPKGIAARGKSADALFSAVSFNDPAYLDAIIQDKYERLNT